MTAGRHFLGTTTTDHIPVNRRVRPCPFSPLETRVPARRKKKDPTRTGDFRFFFFCCCCSRSFPLRTSCAQDLNCAHAAPVRYAPLPITHSHPACHPPRTGSQERGAGQAFFAFPLSAAPSSAASSFLEPQPKEKRGRGARSAGLDSVDRSEAAASKGKREWCWTWRASGPTQRTGPARR
jgi:hypothetical protein